nr:hypothetical protein [Tanacetum cinerariifolium]
MHGRQTRSYGGNYSEHNATSTWVIRHMGNSTANQLKVIQGYNCKDTGERVDSGTYAYTKTTNVIFQSDGIDSFDSDCDEVHAAQASFMANLSDYGLDVLSE